MSKAISVAIRFGTALVLAVLVPIVYAGAAQADVPEGWAPHTDVDAMHTLLVLVLIPLGIVAAIALAVYLPSVIRGESVAPAGAQVNDQWFGGRVEGAAGAPELESSSSDKASGGASGSW